MKSPFYKTGNSKSPLFNHHTVKAIKSMTQSESTKYEYKKLADQLRIEKNDTIFSSTSSHLSKLKSQIYKNDQPFEPKKQKQTRDKNSSKTTYHSIVPKNK